MASRCARRFAFTLSLAAMLAAATGRVDAETFFYAYGGLDGEPTDFAAEAAPGGEKALREVGFDDSLAIGGRIGVWFNRVPWLGIALDGSYFAPEGSGVEMEVMSLTPVLMLRAPLIDSAEFPIGRLQPYVAAGLGVYFAHIVDDFRAPLTRDFDGVSIEASARVEAGLAWRVTRNLALFAEYRRTSPPSRVDERIDTDLDANDFFVGLSLRF